MLKVEIFIFVKKGEVKRWGEYRKKGYKNKDKQIKFV